MSRFPGSFRNPFFGGIAHDEDEADGEDDEGQGYPFGSRPHESFGFSFGPGGSHFHGSFGFEEIFQDFHKLFTDVDKWMASPLELPSAGEYPVDRGRGRSLRDTMLKDPDGDLHKGSKGTLAPEEELKNIPGFRTPERGMPWRPFGRIGDVWKVPPHIRKDIAKEDKDLDLEVSSEGIDHVLKPSDPEMRSFFKSVSVTKVMGPDGTIEEHRTVKDSQGKIETTVSRRKGDQVFERTTITNDEGKKQVSEKVVNMDDRDLEQFTADWKRKDVNSTDLKDASSVLDMFFRGLFSRR
ncbi:HCLS1-associated protein X-1 [Ambystoma mexicanum]|uniref:HCLS1-associated protein X-1 n=1 Tax=Ambystoma mexicanum TaxID=8296 RepID=UPI0037E984F4